MAGIGIITNPHSKLNKRNPKKQELLAYVAGEKGDVKITHSLDELSGVAEEFKGKNIDILAINGGDGTISQTLTTFIKVYDDKPLPPIAILRGGTINMLAQNLGIKGSPEHVLFRLLEAQSRNQFKDKVFLPTLKISGQYGFLFGNGCCHAFLDEFYKNKTGAIGSCLLLLKIIFSRIFSPEYYNKLIFSQNMKFLKNSQKSFEHQSSTVFCSVVEKMPLGKKLFFDLKNETSNYFQCISVISDVKKAWYQIPLSILLKPQHDPKTRMSFLAKELEICCESYGGYTLDGELFDPEDKKVKIELGPTLEFYVI